MTGPAAEAILNGMPHPADLRTHHHDGTTLVTAGQMIIACYPDGDVAMRNVAVAVARQLGFSGQRVAEVMGLSASYVATLRQRARREGAAGLVRPSGPKPKLSPADWARAVKWRQAGASEARIAARLGVAQATVSRHLAGTGQQELPLGGEPGAPAEPGSAGQQPRKQGHRAEPERDEPVPEPERQPEPEQAAKPEPGAAAGAGLVPARAAGPLAGTRIVEGQVTSRYAGAMLLHAFSARAGAGGILAAAGAGEKDGRRFAGAGLLSAVSTCFALGAATVEQFKHLTSGAAGPLAGLAALPGLRTLRPRLAAIADGTDPLELQVMFAQCREEKVDWVTYRRAPLAVPKGLPVLSVTAVNGREREVAWAEETVHIKDYGTARQLTLFERGQVVLQVLTSDSGACPAEILAWLKSRWREVNFLKYAAENYGIDKICDYIAGIEANTKIVDNPARKAANAAVREAEKALAAAERDLAVLLADPAITPAAKNTRLIPAANKKISRAEKALSKAEAARGKIPAKLPANVIDPHARVALL